MGLLRLLTNRRVMGADVLTQAEAWGVYQRIRQDSRVHFLSEPAGLEQQWRRFSSQPQPATNLWTDAYLLAFARLRDLRVVSFDKGFERFTDPQTLVLC